MIKVLSDGKLTVLPVKEVSLGLGQNQITTEEYVNQSMQHKSNEGQ